MEGGLGSKAHLVSLRLAERAVAFNSVYISGVHPLVVRELSSGDMRTCVWALGLAKPACRAVGAD